MAALDAGADIAFLMKWGRWKSESTARLYARTALTVPSLCSLTGGWPVRLPLGSAHLADDFFELVGE